MAFTEYEISTEQGRPIELFELSIGDTTYRHTTTVTSLTVGGNLYTPLAISRSAVNSTDASTEITIPGDHTFINLFVNIAPSALASVTVKRFHTDDIAEDVRVVFKGVVKSVNFIDAGIKAQMSVASMETALDKNIPTRTFQGPCNNALYGALCGVNPLDYRYLGVVTGVDGNTITVSGLQGTHGSVWAIGGYVAYGTLDYRSVIAQSGDVLSLIVPFSLSVLGEEVAVYAGCNRTIGTCHTKFANSLRFGGHPYVPTKNVFATGLE